MRPVLMMAGGTGGHVFPALALAAALTEAGLRVEWLATARGMEQRLLGGTDYPRHVVHVEGLRGRGLIAWLLAPIRLARALADCWRVFRSVQPGAAVGMGGFASGPGGVVARCLGVPLIVHEQNAIPGTTNRLLARIASVVLQAFPDSFPAPVGAITTGNPIRAEVMAIQSRSLKRAPGDPVHVLVLGGSQGARFLNEAVPVALAALGASGLRIRHQTGTADEASTTAHYRALALDAEVTAFIENMAAAYAWADFAICRAGALTVAELATTGLPSLLIPYPHATDQHQRANADWLVSRGAARVLEQREATPERLLAEIAPLAEDHSARRDMALNALACTHAGATARVRDECLRVRHAS